MPYLFNQFVIRDDMVDSLRAYIDKRADPGDFLLAVLEDSLGRAVGSADRDNMENLPAFAVWLYNEAPSIAWGSREKVQAWLSGK